MTGVQSPQILADLYRDLRERRLLPLVLVLVVGVAVVPIALSSSSEVPVTPATAPPAPAEAKSNVPAEQVVVADPGVRDYQRRLDDDTAKDPFEQEFTTPLISPVADTPTAPSGGEAAVPGGTDAVPPTGSPVPTPPTGGDVPQTESRFYFYRVKVRAGKLGEELKVHESVGSLASLPSKKVPAVTFLGVNTNSFFKPKEAVFLVSSAVSSTTGEGNCISGATPCELLSLKPGEHQDLVWTDGRIYRIDLVKFKLIVRNQPASVGGEDSSAGGSGSRKSVR
ncbi:MAG: hypothetical protein ACRDKV_07505 [Solirubrobacterales bacterium]